MIYSGNEGLHERMMKRTPTSRQIAWSKEIVYPVIVYFVTLDVKIFAPGLTYSQWFMKHIGLTYRLDITAGLRATQAIHPLIATRAI